MRRAYQLPGGFALSHSKLKTYLDCPRKFYYENVLKIETPQTYHMLIGTVLHRLAQKIHEGMGDHLFTDLDVLKRIAKDYFMEQSVLFQGDMEKEGWMDYVLERIKDYLCWVEQDRPDVRGLEVPFDFQWPEGMRFTGRIDRLDHLPDGGWSIVDYKKSGGKKEAALINEFRQKDDDFQFPIYYYFVSDYKDLKVSAFRLIAFDFKKEGRLEAITIPVGMESSKKSVSVGDLDEVRQRIVAIAKDVMSVRDDFAKGGTTECRGYFSTCPYLSFCTRSGDDVNDE